MTLRCFAQGIAGTARSDEEDPLRASKYVLGTRWTAAWRASKWRGLTAGDDGHHQVRGGCACEFSGCRRRCVGGSIEGVWKFMADPAVKNHKYFGGILFH